MCLIVFSNWIIIFLFFFSHQQHQSSNDVKVMLKRLNLKSSGIYRCEISAEAPNFSSVEGEGRMEVVCKCSNDKLKKNYNSKNYFCSEYWNQGGRIEWWRKTLGFLLSILLFNATANVSMHMQTKWVKSLWFFGWYWLRNWCTEWKPVKKTNESKVLLLLRAKPEEWKLHFMRLL